MLLAQPLGSLPRRLHHSRFTLVLASQFRAISGIKRKRKIEMPPAALITRTKVRKAWKFRRGKTYPTDNWDSYPSEYGCPSGTESDN